MKKKRRILSILLALTMILTFMPAMAFATDGTSWPEPVDGVITFIGNVTLDNGSVINITDNTVMDLNGYQLSKMARSKPMHLQKVQPHYLI